MEGYWKGAFSDVVFSEEKEAKWEGLEEERGNANMYTRMFLEREERSMDDPPS